MNALSVEDLHVSVKTHFWSKRKAILKGVSFEVEQGEIFGFLGPNGAGKTTSIKAIVGLLRHDKGRISILDGTIDDAAIRTNIGFMPEHPYFPEFITGREFLMQHALLLKQTWREAKQSAVSLLERVGLHGAQDKKLGVYSKGMLQRIGVAQAILRHPKIIILDEPMSGLDPMGRRDIRELIVQLKNQGSTVFFSTHIIPDVEMICDRIAILIDGTIRKTGDVDTLLGTSTSEVEIITSICSQDILTQLKPLTTHITQHGESHLFSSSSLENANRLIDALREHHILIRGVQTHRQSLEDLFVNEVTGKSNETIVRGSTGHRLEHSA
jgi:ABC-2 type transport system ATP-binding protein